MHAEMTLLTCLRAALQGSFCVEAISSRPVTLPFFASSLASIELRPFQKLTVALSSSRSAELGGAAWCR